MLDTVLNLNNLNTNSSMLVSKTRRSLVYLELILITATGLCDLILSRKDPFSSSVSMM